MTSRTRRPCPVIVGLKGTTLTDDERHLLREERPCGVILFRRNLESVQQLFELSDDVRKMLGRRSPIAIDQEGGRVDRLRAIGYASPSAATLGRLGSRACRSSGMLTGRLLLLLGINWNLAPCVDLRLHSYPVSGIGDRSFHAKPDGVRRLAGAYLEGLESSGVAGCLKHFPGHGRARLDSHLDMPRIAARRRYLNRDLSVFKGLSRSHRPIMVAHCTYPALDASGLPATLSPTILTGLLREQMGHQGIVVSDDLEMGAIRRHFGIRDAAARSLRSGSDALLACQSQAAIVEVLEVARGQGGRRLAAWLSKLSFVPRRFAASEIGGLFEELDRLARPRGRRSRPAQRK